MLTFNPTTLLPDQTCLTLLGNLYDGNMTAMQVRQQCAQISLQMIELYKYRPLPQMPLKLSTFLTERTRKNAEWKELSAAEKTDVVKKVYADEEVQKYMLETGDSSRLNHANATWLEELYTLVETKEDKAKIQSTYDTFPKVMPSWDKKTLEKDKGSA